MATQMAGWTTLGERSDRAAGLLAYPSADGSLIPELVTRGGSSGLGNDGGPRLPKEGDGATVNGVQLAF